MFESVRRRVLAFVSCVLVSMAAPAAADPVLDWYAAVDTAITKLPGARADRARAIAWIAAFNALNAIEPRYRPYAPAPPDVGADGARPAPLAALAAALYTALSVEPEADQPLLLRQYRETMAAIKTAPERDAGVALGSRAALLLLAARATDRLGRVEAVLPEPGPGIYVKPADAKMGSSATLAALAPFGVRSVQALDPGPPPPVGSETAAREIAEVRALGAMLSTTRSADQTAAALYWISSGPADYIGLIKPLLEARKLDPLDTTRVFALEAMVNVDSTIANVTYKQRYQHWRPETAITGPHAALADRQAAWQPLVPAPPSPEHPSSGGVGAGASEVLLPRLFGATGAVEWGNAQTQQTRRWPDVASLANEIAMSRIWAGAHFRSGVEAGQRIGRQVAIEVLDRQLLPR